MNTKNKRGVAVSALKKEKLFGMAKQKSNVVTGKLSKTQKRPSVMFGGSLTSKERTLVFKEAAKIISGEKKIIKTDIRLKNYINQAIVKMEK
jgi:ribosomal protein L34E